MVGIIGMFAACNPVNGQGKAITMTGSHASTDTITNAGNCQLTSPVLDKYVGGHFTVSLKVTNVSGTSTFKAILQGSNDGTNWNNVYGVVGTTGGTCDTLQVTSAAPAYASWAVFPGAVYGSNSSYTYTAATRYLYYRINCVGTGTQSTIVSAKILPY